MLNAARGEPMVGRRASSAGWKPLAPREGRAGAECYRQTKHAAPCVCGPVNRRQMSSSSRGAARWVGGEVGLQLYTPAQQIVRGYGRTFWPSHAPRRWQLQRQGHSLALKRGSLSQPLALSRASHFDLLYSKLRVYFLKK